jgi:hypothetical protein
MAFSTACNSASVTTIVSKWRPFCFIFNQGDREIVARGQVRQVESVGDDSHVVFDKKNLLAKMCEMAHCHNATATTFIAKFRYPHLHAVTVKCHSSIQNWLFGLYDEFFVKNPLDVKENGEHARDCSSPVSPFSVSVSLDFSIRRIVALSHGHNCKSSFRHQWHPWTKRLHNH